MLLHVSADNQITAWRAGLAGLAFAAQGQLQPGEGPGRHVDVERALRGHMALAAAVRTRIRDNRAASTATAAGLLHPEKALAEENDAVTVAVPAGGRSGPAAHA